MKDYEEIANTVLERRDAYVARQKQKRKTVMKITSAVGAVALVALVGLGLNQTGWLENTTPPVDTPATTVPTAVPTENDGTGIGGDNGDGECGLHSRDYHVTIYGFTYEMAKEFVDSLGENFDPEDVNIINFVRYHGITREEFIEKFCSGTWAEGDLDEIVWNHGTGCPYTKRQFVDAIYGDDPELTAWVFAPRSTWPYASNWVELEREKGDWPPEGYGFGETRPVEEPAE